MNASFRASVAAARERLAAADADFRQRHASGVPGTMLCVAISDLRDQVVRILFDAAMKDLYGDAAAGLADKVALVAHGGYGRRDVSPGSDVDLMLLHAADVSDQVIPLADRMLRDVFDVGLTLGHSVRTPEQAVALGLSDAVIGTSLMESRLVAGSTALFDRFFEAYRRRVHRRFRPMLAAVSREREEERIRYGETVFLLEPNVKRSRGGLRDVQFVRWIGFARYGVCAPRELHAMGSLSAEDAETLDRGSEFLLQLRNELHFSSSQASDVLTRAQQLRIAQLRQYPPVAGMLPVEQFMREYFRHTSGISNVAQRFEAKALTRERLARWVTSLVGHRIEHGVRVGPLGVMASSRKLGKIRGDLAAVVRLVDLANLYDTVVDPITWDAIRRDAPNLPRTPSPEACRHFLSLLGHPARLGRHLRSLHEAGILERFIPEFAHARGLLQFNQYHKYTVDEHCIRAVEVATELLEDAGPVGRVYRAMPRKDLLHLALLLHDLGKGRLEDHREVGVTIARNVAARLGLSHHDAEMLRFLVHKHMMMNHLAFRRDTGDEEVIVRLAVQVGSPETLEMLYVTTACDLGAVGPGVWDDWKSVIVTDLFRRTMQYLAVESTAAIAAEQLAARRDEVRIALGQGELQSWFAEQLDNLPASYLKHTPPRTIAADLRFLRGLKPSEVKTDSRWLGETSTLEYTVGASESLTPGIFHKLTGALASQGLEIRSAEIITLADGLVLDRFWVSDPDFTGQPPQERLASVEAALAASLKVSGGAAPTFRRTWKLSSRQPALLPASPTRVSVDNSTSARCTILDIFTHDRPGLLFAITKTLFELGLSVWRAKIATYLDQVVDVFYVTDADGRKIDDPTRLDEIRECLVTAIERHEAA